MEIENAENSGNGDELKAKRREFFDTLLAATRETPSEKKPFATCVMIDGYLLGSLVVAGLPLELRLPLSPRGADALRSVSNQAPHGQGKHTLSVRRRAWQLDASKVSFPNDPHFLTRIQEIATLAVKELETENSVPVEAHLNKVLYLESGGHFQPHRDTEKVPGMFGTLVVQLPTHKGFEGGELVVSLKRERKVFNCAEKASTRMYCSMFFEDCEHFLEPMKGRRLCLSFNLVRQNAGNVVRESNFETPLFRKVEDVLRPWLEEVDKEESNSKLYRTILAVPLQHEYTPADLSFAGLKGEDADLCQVLVNCLERRLDVHLFLMTKKKMGTPAGLGEFPRGQFRAPWTDSHIFSMAHVYDKEIATSVWVGVDDQKLPIYPWYVNPKTEVVLGSDEKPFYEDPDEFKYKCWAGNRDPSLDYLYHRALVGIWPKSKAVATVTESRRPNNFYFAAKVPEDAEVLSLLNMVERLHQEKYRHAPLVLRQLLVHCEKKYEGIWNSRGRDTEKASSVSSRLLDMCTVAGDLTDTLRVLKLHSEVFQVKEYDSNGDFSHKVPWFIGLQDPLVCKSIAGAVHSHGWTACGEAVLLLLQKDRLIAEGEHYVQLAVELQQLGHPEEALLIATKTMKLVSGSERAPGHSQLLSSVVKMLCISEKCLQELSTEFSEWVKVMGISGIIQVLNELSTSMLKGSVDEQRIAVKQDSGVFLLFLTFFDKLVARDFLSPVSSGLTVGLVHKFISLGDSKVLDSLMRPLLRQADLHPEQPCLKELIASDLLWNALVVDAAGKDTLRALLESRLAWLASSQKPEFSWCQPFAKLPQLPTIEEFLRGPQRSLTYHFLFSLPEARELALLFDGQYHNGYCATGTEGGRGLGAYCEIQKSRVAFEHVLNHWVLKQVEKKKVEDKLQIVRELWDGPGATVKQERAIERDEIQAGVKRQRVNEEKE